MIILMSEANSLWIESFWHKKNIMKWNFPNFVSYDLKWIKRGIQKEVQDKNQDINIKRVSDEDSDMDKKEEYLRGPHRDIQKGIFSKRGLMWGIHSDYGRDP